MTGILDTPVFIELLKTQPDSRILNFFSNQTSTQFYTSVFTIAEISKKISNLPGSNKKKSLETWLAEFSQEFEKYILTIDLEAAFYFEHTLKSNLKNLDSPNLSLLLNISLSFSKRLPLITFTSTPLPSLPPVQILNLFEIV